MAQRVTFHPQEMRRAARRLDRGAAENHDIMVYLKTAPLFDVPRKDLEHRINPRLDRVRRHAFDRRGVLHEMARFIRARALLAEIADGTRDAKGKVGSGDVDKLLPDGPDAVIEGVARGIARLARDMERAFLAGGWLENGRLRGRSRSGKRPPLPWAKVAKWAKRVPVLGHFANAAEMFNALFGTKNKGKRIEAAGGVLGSAGLGTLGAAATVALMTGAAPVTIGIVAIGAAFVGGYFGAKAGKYIGKNVVVPLWNGVKDIGRALKSVAGLAVKGLKIIGIG